ncbi:MAG: hypothetical protein OEM52_12090 [bacterium]|nr:hypothetical protein [bacterium]
MSWQKLRGKLAEYHTGTVSDVEYLVICQVYHTFLDVACNYSRHVPHQERFDLTHPDIFEQYLGQVRDDLIAMKSKIDPFYHNLVEETFEEAKQVLLK